MKKTLFLTLTFFFALATNSHAENFNFTSYYPAPAGNYTSIRLTPQSALAANNCPLGAIYANADDNSLPYFCGPTVGLPAFAPLPGTWTLSGNNLYLTDTTTPENKKVGIGTTAPIFKLTLDDDGGILADGAAAGSSTLPVSGAGTRLIWYPLKGAFRAGYVDGNQWDDANIGDSSTAMGYGNTAAQELSVSLGGFNNLNSGFESFILGGNSNTIAPNNVSDEIWNSGIVGGQENSIPCATDGWCWRSLIFGGYQNTVSNSDGSITGGKNNLISNSYAHHAHIAGGDSNTNYGEYGAISGGYLNSMSSDLDTIAGGRENTSPIAEGWTDTVSGGRLNKAEDGNSTVSGGYNNYANYAFAIISGGANNTTGGNYGTIIGGDTNKAGIAGTSYCSVAGGKSNTASGNYSTVLGGDSNTASGTNAIIPGGQSNSTMTSYSLSAGRNMNLTSNGSSFLWGYSTNAMSSASSYSMILYSTSMGIRDTNPAALLEINGNSSTDDYLNLTSTSAANVGNVLTIKNNGFVGVKQIAPANPLEFGNGAYVSAAGNFINASSREYKENINALKAADALNAFSNLTPVQYNYKNEPDHRYLGFIAEDVPDLVTTKNRDGLSSMDIAAVLTKVIQHQHDILKEQAVETQRLQNEITELKKRYEKTK